MKDGRAKKAGAANLGVKIRKMARHGANIAGEMAAAAAGIENQDNMLQKAGAQQAGAITAEAHICIWLARCRRTRARVAAASALSLCASCAVVRRCLQTAVNQA